jgi:hypothetical protein
LNPRKNGIHWRNWLAVKRLKPIFPFPMSGAAPGKEQVNAQIPTALVQKIDERAEALLWKRAKFIGQIILDWEERGCPPIGPEKGMTRYQGKTEGPEIGSPVQRERHHARR